MRKPQAAPANWKLDEVWALVMQGTEEICAIHSGNKAHARLITAAPDLLAALEDLKKELWAAGLKLNVRRHFSLLAADAQAGTAIAKAKGEL